MSSQLLILAISIGTMWLGAIWIVESASRLARRLGLSDLVIGLTVVAIGTSLPEMAVSVDAAFEGSPDIALGNVIGSNIFNIGIILGIVALFRSIRMSRQMVYRDGLMLLSASFLLAIFLVDFRLTRWEGGVLVSLIIAYLIYLGINRELPDEEAPAGKFTWTDLPRLGGGLLIVLVSAHYLVVSASALARGFGVSEWLIGVTIVALGTSTPEIATSVAGLMRGFHNVSAGNLIGSDLFNTLGVLGLAAIITPFAVSTMAQQSIPYMAGMVLVLVIMMRSGWHLTRFEGGVLVCLGILRWAIDIGGG